jgi:predicted O-methyltransferase YrrM
MRDIKMVIDDNGIYPSDKFGMFYARNSMHEYYCEVAKILGNGNILEIGYGMGICSKEIQKQNPKSHTIIEINKDIYENGLEWSKSLSNVKMILGDWYDVIPTLNQKYDGIFIDTIEDGNIHQFEKYASMVSINGTILSAVHYSKMRNTNVYYKKIDGLILNWAVYDGYKFKTNSDKSKLI